MLLGSGSRFAGAFRGKQVGATIWGAQMLGWDSQGRRNNRSLAWGGQWALGKSAVPAGRTHPTAWLMPTSSGSIASQISGELSTTATPVMGLAAEGQLSGDLTLTGNGGLIASAVGALSGDLSMTASIVAIARAIGEVSGELTLAAEIGALAGLSGSIDGVATLAATPYATAVMSGDIASAEASTLTAESIAAAVWGASVPDAYADGAAGALMGELLTTAKFIGLSR